MQKKRAPKDRFRVSVESVVEMLCPPSQGRWIGGLDVTERSCERVDLSAISLSVLHQRGWAGTGGGKVMGRGGGELCD